MTTTPRGLPLVTGATGFAGSHLVDRLLETHPEVAAWANLGGRAADRSDPRVRWHAVDILDPASLEGAVRNLQPRTIFHLAGRPHAGDSWKNAERALRVNALGTHHLLDAVRRVSPQTRVVLAGSALVYRRSDRALREEDPMGPADPYGTSKLAQEMVAARAATPVVRTRPFNHAGPRQSEAFMASSFARQIAEIEAGLRPPRLLVGNLEARRDILDVRDTVRAYERLADAGDPAQVYNICSGVAWRVGDLLDRLLTLARVDVAVEQDPARLRPSDTPLLLGDPSRLADETGWRAAIPIDTTLDDLLGWWRRRISPTS